MKTRLISAALILLVSSLGVHASAKSSYESSPGYVNIEALADIQSEDTLTEVNLRTPLLKLASQIIEDEEPDVAKMIGSLELVRVYVLEMNEANEERLMSNHESVEDYLEGKSWDTLVTVNSDDEQVGIHTLFSEDGSEIIGLVVNVMDGSEAVVVNIVGKIDLEQIAALGSALDIPELSELKDHLEES